MNKLFDINNPFFKFMSKFFDLMVLSLIFTVCCIPIVTIGPAITALYYSTVKNVRRDRSYAYKEFFHSFKRDFRQSIISWLIILGVTIVILLDIRILNVSQDKTIGPFRIVYLVAIALIAFITMYVFPLISRFTLSMKDLFKLAFFLSLKYFPETILSLVILAAGFVALYVSYFVFLFFVPGAVAILISFPMEHVLKKTLKQIGTGEDNNPDQWYEE